MNADGKPVEKRKVGRPVEYSPDICPLLVEHMAGGLSFESFCAVVFKSKETLYRWVDLYPEFSDAKKLGTQLCRDWWEREGLAGMREKVFNSPVWIFNMKNRFGWGDKQTIEHTGKDGAPIQTQSIALTPEQLDARIKELELKRLESANDDN